ncbi:DNA adenine methylase [Cytobacillus praedii]|uniref:DNA adenine methylase n=1 Tax=Cytobacillus praedii TaxID=1742358 RepID=UPI002E1F8D2C|nr:DNA adenine methylase [Cytobacillus praedii]MED3575884.1 DNA adenine methylase [Cytobacillus praedii]
MLICEFCGLDGAADSNELQLDKNRKGFWCESCDSYTYMDEESTKHQFTLILETSRKEDKVLQQDKNLKFSKQLSPFRYPGGKSKIINFLYSYLQPEKSKILISPFAGGGSFELSMLEAGVVDKLHLNDLDFGVYAVWWVMKHMPFSLIDRLLTSKPNHSEFFIAQALIKSNFRGADKVEAAWATLLVNRLAYSGISKANPLGGKKGKKEDLLSRWNPEKLIKKIERIHSMSDQIEITNENTVSLIEEKYWLDNTTIFIDPPYFFKGKDLYQYYFTDENHLELAYLLDNLHREFPCADILLTYDYSK